MGSVFIGVGIMVMIVVHEGAHFVAAKMFKMKATEAFFGFGPKLWSITRGETEYGIKAIPLGGYVRIVGMNPLEEVDPAEEHRTYRGKPFWQKSVVVLAGIASHFVVAFFLFIIAALMFGTLSPTLTIEAVSEVFVSGSASEPLVLFNDDRVVTVDGVPLAEFLSVDPDVGDLIDVVVIRDGAEVTLATDQMILIAPAGGVDIRPGDLLTAVNGVPLATWDEFVDIAHLRPNLETAITVERRGELIEVVVTLAEREVDGEVQGFLGVAPVQERESLTLVEGVKTGTGFLVTTTKDAVVGLASLVTAVPKLIGGAFSGDGPPANEIRPISPIGLVRIAGPIEIAVGLLASVNIFVGILNLFPMYPLDGGHFVVALFEKVTGRHPDVQKLAPYAGVVLVFLVVLGLYGVFLDIFDPLELP
ncbi:MAG: site-2 protease family protein [Acidobacteria bacterium]|nr:site-2 protease family protein [Acidobacteriota bacterium]